MEQAAPLGRSVTIEEVGNTSAFLLSDLASGITGDVIYVDAGFHAMGAADDRSPVIRENISKKQ